MPKGKKGKKKKAEPEPEPKSVKQSPAFGNPLHVLAEDSFDGETKPRALGTFESEDVAQLASTIETTMRKAKQLPEMEMRALFDGVNALLFTGGDLSLFANTTYYQAAQRLYGWALAENGFAMGPDGAAPTDVAAALLRRAAAAALSADDGRTAVKALDLWALAIRKDGALDAFFDDDEARGP